MEMMAVFTYTTGYIPPPECEGVCSCPFCCECVHVLHMQGKHGRINKPTKTLNYIGLGLGLVISVRVIDTLQFDVNPFFTALLVMCSLYVKKYT